ncbi:MAG: 16S rRNA (cytosine(967)-C(5))-methyltransferase RsmB [Ruminococcaceae bacterium]|nr:16S rRNA (cytosine(967)-C(5))-methyltransferase RsmB [Oscillospiraceae bacterium]
MADWARTTAFRLLCELERSNGYPNEVLGRIDTQENLSARDRNFIRELVYGITERKQTLDYMIAQYSGRKLNKIDPRVITVLRMGLYQLHYMDRVPASAAVNESVNLAKQRINPRVAGFVNGVLRASGRNPVVWPQNTVETLCIRYSYPNWLINRWIGEFGENFVKEMLESNDKKPTIYLRCNQLRTTPEELLNRLSEEGVSAEIDNRFGLDCALRVTKMAPLETLPSYHEGLFYIQDIGAMLIGAVLNPKAGERVIDLCAAPGGKTTHIAEMMRDTGEILAFDVSEKKQLRIQENAKRLGIKIIDACIGDGAVTNPSLVEWADRVLVDAPCSGLGIIRRKSDIKYRRTQEDITTLSNLGFSLLENGARYCKKGGTLVYSTCTVEREENEQVIERFLKENDNWQLSDYNGCGYRTLYPHLDDTDGFFICKLKKRS